MRSEHLLQTAQAGGPVAQVQAEHRPAVLGEHLRVPGGLRSDQLPEREGPVRDLEVLRRRPR